jgi:Icc-related predicted phosphoesterase
MGLLKRRARSEDGPDLTLFHAADIHGADPCWRKFVGAGHFYGADAVILGGDMAGKAVIPIELGADGRFSAEELAELEAAIRFNGMYPWAAPRAEIERADEDRAERDALTDRLIIEELERWIKLGDERFAHYGVQAVVMGGNDDPWSIERVLDAATWVQNGDARILRVGNHELLSLGWSNVTPWHTEREASEEELYARLKPLAEQLEDPSTAIFNIHVPPYDTGLDSACEVRESDLTLVYEKGAPHVIPVGSHAVRQIIEEYQPLLSLHGHIHESRGATTIGRTVCINPGSEYNSGRLLGVLLTVTDHEVRSRQFIAG